MLSCPASQNKSYAVVQVFADLVTLLSHLTKGTSFLGLVCSNTVANALPCLSNFAAVDVNQAKSRNLPQFYGDKLEGVPLQDLLVTRSDQCKYQVLRNAGALRQSLQRSGCNRK